MYGQQPPYGQQPWGQPGERAGDHQPYPDQPHPQQAWGQYGAQPTPWGVSGWAPQRRTNTAAIWALIMSIVFPPVGLILGLIARAEVRRTGEDGAGIARAAIIISIVYFAFIILFVVLVVVVASTHPGQLPDSTTG